MNIKAIAGELSDYSDAMVKRKEAGKESSGVTGRKLTILSTYDKLSAADILNTYLDQVHIKKMFKMFWHLKTDEYIESVRQRLERKVIASYRTGRCH